jgi:uncharacterized protein (TIGR02996 family)
MLGVEHTPTGPRLRAKPDTSVIGPAASLFDYYLNDSRYGWIVSVAESLEEKVGATNLFVRNKARALHKMGQYEAADAEFQRAIGLEPNDDTTYYFYADCLDDWGRYAEAYEMYEKAIQCDPNDGTRFIALANHIMLRGWLRNDEGKIVGQVPRVERQRAAAPLYIRALQDEYRNLRNSIVTALVEFKLVKEAEAIAAGQVPQGDYNDTPLQYVEALIARR